MWSAISVSLSDRPQEDTGTSWATFVYIRSATAGRWPLARPSPAHKQSPKPQKLKAKQTRECSKASAVNNTHTLVEETHLPSLSAVERMEEKNRKRKRRRRENSMPPVWLKASRLLFLVPRCFELNSCESLTPALNPWSPAAAAQLSALKGGRQGTREKGSYVESPLEGGEGELPTGLPVHYRRLPPRETPLFHDRTCSGHKTKDRCEPSRRDETRTARLKRK